MKKKRFRLNLYSIGPVVVALSLLISACGELESSPDNPPIPDRIETLWSSTISLLLREDLWISQNNYDAAHVLMIPMHWAFSDSSRKSLQQEFENYFERFVSENNLADETNELRKLQYLYLHSQYLKVKYDNGLVFSNVDEELRAQLYDELQFQWVERGTQIFGSTPPYQGMRERLAYKLDNFYTEPEYARAIFDEEFYLISISADLLYIDDGSIADPNATEIVDFGYRMYIQESIEVGDGFLFQPGVWSHYRDYVYSGHLNLAPDLPPMILDDIATDSSHLHRYPLWLLSIRDAFAKNTSEYNRLDGLFDRLLWQFENVILVEGDDSFAAPRLNNFSDGWNGIYRYKYDTVGSNNELGYGPFGISGTLPYSWYPFLQSDILRSEFSEIKFPLADAIVDLYVGPNTTRVRHPLVKWPDYFVNGFAELNILLAIELE